jgi:hypothetical protein
MSLSHYQKVSVMRISLLATSTNDNTSVLSPKYEVFCRRSVGCFSRRERSAHICVIRVDPPRRRKNSQLASAQRVAMKMGRRLRCSSVTYQFRYAPLAPVRLGPPCRRTILIATKYLVFRGQDTSPATLTAGGNNSDTPFSGHMTDRSGILGKT